MTDPETPQDIDETQEDLERLKQDVQNLDRPSRAISIPDKEDEDGIGRITSVVP